MPVQLEWHASLPILIATYPDSLSRKAYYAMCDQRQALLDESSAQNVIVLADVRRLIVFPEAQVIVLCETVVAHPRVRHVCIVLEEDFYRHLAPAMLPAEGTLQHRVDFFKDYDTALGQAAEWLSGPGGQS